MTDNSEKKHPFNEGYAKRIYRLWIAPLTIYKPGWMDLSFFHNEVIFNSSHRDITRFKVKSEFKMPGELYVAGAVKVQGVGYRRAQQGSVLYVREDNRSEFVDVEMLSKRYGTQVFCMSTSDWGRIRLNCEPADGQPKPKK